MSKLASTGLARVAVALCLFGVACEASPLEPERVATAASSLMVAGLFATGVDANGTPLPTGSVDPHYVLSSTDPSFPGPNAYAVDTASNWTPNTATSKWISIQVSAQGKGGSVYTYTTTFTLSGVNPTTATIAGQWACEHSCVLNLNGTVVATDPTPAWNALAPFTVPAGGPFVAGTNTLAVIVNNTSGGPTGARIDAVSLTAASASCTVDTDCTGGGSWCDESTHTCTAKLANGTAIPNDPPHTNPTLNGMCTAQAGALVCVSGVCDTQDNKCGYANGDGPCKMANGAAVCRSTVCDSGSMVCAPCDGDLGSSAKDACSVSSTPYCFLAGPNLGQCGRCSSNADCTGHPAGSTCDTTTGACGTSVVCHSDSDCQSGDWCNAPPGGSGACTAKLGNGVTLPTSPSNVATCTVAVGERVCQSGVCDPRDNACGYANGDGPCTTSTACRMGACDASTGTCGVVHCAKDADCPQGDYCKTDGTCALKQPDGKACDAANQCLSNSCATQLCGNGFVPSGSGVFCTMPALGPGGSHSEDAAGLLLLLLAVGGVARRRRT
jgi:hypothetical protein